MLHRSVHENVIVAAALRATELSRGNRALPAKGIVETALMPLRELRNMKILENGTRASRSLMVFRPIAREARPNA